MGEFEGHNQKYAEAFTRMRERCGLTLQDISKRSGIAASTITRTLQGSTGTPMATYEILVTKGLGASMFDFIAEIYGSETQKLESAEASQNETAAVKLLLAEKDARIRQLNAWLRLIVVYSVSVTSIFVGLFVFDILNPSVGWFRRQIESMQSNFTGWKV